MSTIVGKILRGISHVGSAVLGAAGSVLTAFPPTAAIGAAADVAAAGLGAAGSAYDAKDAAKAANVGIGQPHIVTKAAQAYANNNIPPAAKTTTTDSAGNLLPYVGIGYLLYTLV